ncbi:MAG: response regulator transcription factor [Chitinophagaceae bacterium]|nr:response regulator transcription factor [Chitinophagaceae bacterium]
MINAIIVDDEQHCVDRLSGLLQEHFGSSVRVLDSFNSVEKALAGSRQLQPDLVFLDMRIQEKTGFDLLNGIEEINFDVIFTTAYEKYAVQAFKFSAVDYLLKPIDADELKSALERLQARISKLETARKIDALFNNMKAGNNASKRIGIHTVNGITYIPVSDIIRCESAINYTTVFMKDNKRMTVAKTLKEFEDMLADYNFFRVHNSHLVNLHFVKQYHKGKGGYISMSDQSEVEVSTRRKDDLLKKLSML